MNKKAERGRATRDQLIEVATGLFADRGYEDTSIEAVLHASGVSRGALYHHFAGKEALFLAVLESVEAGIAEKLNAAVASVADPVDVLRTGCLAWVRLAGDPVVQQIVLIDAPSVIGWQRWRALDEQYALGTTKGLLRLIAGTGRLPVDLADRFAHMLLAALSEIALLIARADDVPAALVAGETAVEEFLRRLLEPVPR